MNLKRIGIGTLIVAIFVIGIGIGLKLTNSDMDSSIFSITGGILISAGLLILVLANKKIEK